MKHYKVINLKRQGAGPIVLTESAWKLNRDNPNKAKHLKLIGECDAAGNMLADIAKGNFLHAAKKTEPVAAAPIPEPAKTVAEPETQFHDFTDTETNGKKTNTGESTGTTGSGKQPAAGKRTKKAPAKAGGKAKSGATAAGTQTPS